VVVLFRLFNGTVRPKPPVFYVTVPLLPTETPCPGWRSMLYAEPQAHPGEVQRQRQPAVRMPAPEREVVIVRSRLPMFHGGARARGEAP